MNAKFLERMIVYRESHGLAFARLLLSQKIRYQLSIVGKKNLYAKFKGEIENTSDIAGLLLVEARGAKRYWKEFGKQIQLKIAWFGRQAHCKDPANKILDIGYHYLTQKIINICHEINLPTELGILHKAQSGKAHPLAYDFIEPLRPIMVDDVFLKITGKKKKQIGDADEKLISYFLYKIKRKSENYYFHRELGYCITLDYWIRLMLLKFMSYVHSDKDYQLLFPSLRHESRCTKNRCCTHNNGSKKSNSSIEFIPRSLG